MANKDKQKAALAQIQADLDTLRIDTVATENMMALDEAFKHADRHIAHLHENHLITDQQYRRLTRVIRTAREHIDDIRQDVRDIQDQVDSLT